MALHIDTNNVTLMSEFKSAIEDYVEKAIDNKLEIAIKGIHGYEDLQQSATGFSNKVGNYSDEMIPIKLTLPLPNTKHWGILNIKRDSASVEVPQVQIFFWWENSQFKYKITHNALSIVVAQRDKGFVSQYVIKDSIQMKENEFSFQIMNKAHPNVPGSSYHSRDFASFSVDYHIW